ncbi:hypothetical protein OsJ_35357 [Oryza sativa Japonica Group]|uniref:Uncharacterized protein n=1 Tax=Oryza sativa subsp. japonica TaxID=39947 RepID=B9GC23_ORYSJ|nr:hypothetical protein OsJ_35357 [Oryza sativa Japonica Group]
MEVMGPMDLVEARLAKAHDDGDAEIEAAPRKRLNRNLHQANQPKRKRPKKQHGQLWA